MRRARFVTHLNKHTSYSQGEVSSIRGKDKPMALNYPLRNYVKVIECLCCLVYLHDNANPTATLWGPVSIDRPSASRRQRIPARKSFHGQTSMR